MASIDEVVARVPQWQGRAIAVAPLSGGLTNVNYRVEVDGTPHVVRIPGKHTALLSINRAHEYHNTLAAAQAGVGARVVHYLPDLCVMVLELIPGATMSPASLRAPGMVPRIARSVHMLHAGPPFANTFNMFRLVEFYLQIVRRHGFTIPDGYRDCLPTVRRIEQALTARPLPPVPCHNDLMSENFIDEGALLRLVDYEYSGANDPCFELAHICNEAEFSPQQAEDLCRAYFGRASRAILARLWLQYCMANIGWTLWGAIQTGVSEIEFDFWDWTLTRWRRAQETLASPDFSRWLEQARSAT